MNSAALDNELFVRGRFVTLRRAAALVAAVLVLVICWNVVGVRLSTVFRASTADALWTFLRGLFPPDLSFGFLRVVSRALFTTLATAIAGTFLSVLIAIPLATVSTPILWRRGILVAAAEGSPHAILRAAASRAVLAFLGFLRAIPDLVWGLLFVTAVGLGSLAGTLALAVSYAGVLGRVYAYAFADVDPRPLEALQAIGATRGQIFLRGIWPQCRPAVTAYTIYSFECCVRAASVLGFVGAGGLAYEISLSMRLFQYGQALTLMLAFVLLLASTDVVSRRLRRSLEPNSGHVKNTGQQQGNAASKGATVRSVVRWAPHVAVASLLTASFYFAGFTRQNFSDAHVLGNMVRFCRGMFPPDFAKGFVFGLGPLVLQTLAISILGTFMGILIGGLLAISATSSLVLTQPDSPGAQSASDRSVRWSIFWAARLTLNVLRSIPDLVWVLICIVVIGIGPFAGTVAIGLHTAGVLGKLYAETLEEVSRKPVEALRALGAGPFQILWWGLWPQAKRMLANYTIVRWETNLRISAILGLVGGGGLGQAVYNDVQLGFYARLSTLLLAIYALVMISDWIGDTVFRRSVSS